MKTYKKIIILAVLILAAGGFSAYTILTSRVRYNSDSATGNTAGNLMNGGLFAEQNGIIYFANPYDSNELYSMKSDCSGIKKLSDDTVSYINVCDNYIFYVRNNYDASSAGNIFRGQLYGIIRASLNGKHSKSLTTDIASQMILKGNTLIYTRYDDNNIDTRRVSIDMKESSIASSDEIPLYCLYGGFLYYSGTERDHNVYSFNCSSGSSSLFFEGNTYLASMVDGWLYYIDLSNGYALTKYNPVTSETLVLSTKRCINYNVYGDVVFYQTEGEENSLRRMNTDGTGDVLIMDCNADTISCTSQYTFFTVYNQSVLYRCPTHGTGAVEMMSLN